jgi:hypothetical protein
MMLIDPHGEPKEPTVNENRITFEQVTRSHTYAKNGNLANPTPRTYWVAKADGKNIGSGSTLKAVKEIAAIWLADPSMR